MKKKDIQSEFLPDPVTVIDLLREASSTENEISGDLGLSRAQSRQLSRLLSRLQGTGIIRRSGHVYRWADSPKVFIGRVRQRRRKTITFSPSDPEQQWTARVSPDELSGAFDSDLVIASIRRPGFGPPEARVEMLLQRGRLLIVGRLHLAYRLAFVESLDEKFPFNIDVEPGPDDEDGKIVTVEITSYPSPHHHPAGIISERLGAFSTDPGLDIEIIIRKHDLPHEFPPEVENEVAGLELSRVNPAGRLDLRDRMIVTIDGETARDFDDAVSLDRLPEGDYLLGVHIADVASYVSEGSALDHEARLRGTSVYFPERAIPMLPEELSNGICSLRPEEDRLTLSAMMRLNSHGRVVSYSLRRSVIHSRARMTYTDVNHVLQGTNAEVCEKYRSFAEFFHSLRELAEILIRMRQERGAIDFNLPEAIFQFNDEGQIAGVIKAERNIAHRIIEEFMLLANETVAGHFERLGVPAVYRVHEQPDPRRVEEFADLASNYGFRFPTEGVKSFDYQRLSHLLEGKPEEKILAYAMLRSLQRARYSAENLGHFGLASSAYTHFTSPIRRYPDLLVHRLIHSLIERDPGLGESEALRKDGRPRTDLSPITAKAELEAMARESSERERAASAAEMELEEWRKAMLMAKNIGEEFSGLIISVRDFGFFVELNEIFVEGLVSVSSLGDDYYSFDSRRHALVGRQGRKVFRIGDLVKVRVARVNTDRHLVDFELISGRPGPSSPPRKPVR